MKQNTIICATGIHVRNVIKNEMGKVRTHTRNSFCKIKCSFINAIKFLFINRIAYVLLYSMEAAIISEYNLNEIIKIMGA